MKATTAECGICIRCRAQFHLLGAYVMRCFNLLCIGIDEKACEDPRLSQTTHGSAYDRDVALHVQATFGSYLVCRLLLEKNKIGPYFESDFQHFFSRRHLQIQISRDACAQAQQICILNVPAITSQVYSDAIGACLFTQHSGGDYARLRRAPCLPYCSDVIDINVEARSH